jgi:hypothetical protein
MNHIKNPYPESLVDEASGIEVPDSRHRIWAEGYRAGRKDKAIISSVMKAENGVVLVFDARGEQIPEYQGLYQTVKPRILKDAPPAAIFYAFDNETELKTVPRNEW